MVNPEKVVTRQTKENKKTKTQYEKLTTTQGTQAEDKQNKCVGHNNTQAMNPPTNNWR